MRHADGGAIKILLVDDHPIVREGYRRLLERLGGFRVVGEAGEAAAAYDIFRGTEPDVVVMDISMPGASGLEAMRHIRQWDPRATDSRLLDALHGSLGAQGLRSRRQRLCSQERRPLRIRRGDPRRRARRTRAERRISRVIAREAIAGGRSILESLSPRETEILRQIALGSTSQEIAATLNVSIKTVQNHHYRIKDKIGARSDGAFGLASRGRWSDRRLQRSIAPRLISHCPVAKPGIAISPRNVGNVSSPTVK